jgi:hypothetical protein
MICRYFEPYKISEDNVIANRTLTSCYTIKILKRLWGKR